MVYLRRDVQYPGSDLQHLQLETRVPANTAAASVCLERLACPAAGFNASPSRVAPCFQGLAHAGTGVGACAKQEEIQFLLYARFKETL